MKTKIVYVVTCSEKNTYLEQALVSVYSARLHNPDAGIYIVTDDISAKYIDSSRTEIKKYLTDVLVFDTPADYNPMKRSRYLKTNLRELIEGDFVYIDTDTVICQPLDELDNFTDDVSGVASLHKLYKVNERKKANEVYKSLGVEIKEDFAAINGGVIIAKDTEVAHNLYKAWFECWKYCGTKGMFMDQWALHMAELKTGYKIKDVSGIWNCQLEARCLNYLHNAKIIHFFSMGSDGKASPYMLRHDDIYQDIKRSGKLTEQVLGYINNPYEAFVEDNAIISGMKTDFLTESWVLFILYRDHPKLWSVFIKTVNFCGRIIKAVSR